MAVLGVMPILWNAGKAIQIYRYLKTSLPPRAKEYVELSLDLAGGVVTVTAEPLLFDINAFQSLGAGMLAASCSTLHVHYTDSVNLQGIGASWMGLLAADVPIKQDRYRNVQRFTVDSALRTEAIKVDCDWCSFVILALALGTSPSDLDFKAVAENQAGIFNFKTLDSTQEIMTVTLQNRSVFAKLKPRGLKVSWQAAYAWTLTVMFINAEGNLVMVPLIDEKRRADGGIVPSISNGSFKLQEHQMELKNSDSIWSDALTWTLYTEEVFSSSGELLPVPQYLLKLREDALQDLQGSIDIDEKLDELFPAMSVLKGNIKKDLQTGWSELLHVESTETTFRPFHSDLQARGEIWHHLEQVPLFKTLYANYGPKTFSKSHQSPDALEKTTLN
jgi:hypothetical protein